MPRHLPFFIILILIALASPALAQTPNNTGFNISWAALDPGTDWVAQVITSVFPINGNTCQGGGGTQPSTCTGTAATVIGTIVGQLTGFVLAIAMAFVCYLTIINIHRVAEVFTDSHERHDVTLRREAGVWRHYDVPVEFGFLHRPGRCRPSFHVGNRHGKNCLCQRRHSNGPRRLGHCHPDDPRDEKHRS